MTTNTTVLITGAARGIVLELTRQYAESGHTVIATARDPGVTALVGLRRDFPGKVETFRLEVTDASSITALAESLAGRPLQLLINNAGSFASKAHSLDDLEAEAWLEELHINTVSPFMITRALIGNLKAAGNSIVAMMSSKMGSMSDNAAGGAYAYRSSKAGLNAVVCSLAHDLADDGITVVALHPGWVRTDMGGPNALIDVQTSAAGLKRVLDGLHPAQGGRFFDYTGADIPW